MSLEKYQEREPVLSPESHESATEIAEILRDLYQNTTLKGGKLEIPNFSKEAEMNACENRTDSVTQQLRAVIKAGQEFFGLVQATTLVKIQGETKPYIVESTVLTKHNADERASVVAIIEKGQGIERVGRAHQHNLGDQVSRHHFYLEQKSDGSITVTDGNIDGTPSTNGTEVFELKDGDYAKDIVDSPLDDIDFWSAKSSEVKQKILQSIF